MLRRADLSKGYAAVFATVVIWSLPSLFGAVALFCIVLGLALAVFVKPMKKIFRKL